MSQVLYLNTLVTPSVTTSAAMLNTAPGLVHGSWNSPSRTTWLPPVCLRTQVAFGVIRALSYAAVSQWQHIDTLWDIAVSFIWDEPGYWHDIAGSDFPKNIVIGCSQPAPDKYLIFFKLNYVS
ncbi:hypothetical protein BC828DRAFT_196209 [Blastocladiella britannica]|nr:hypothetical protein BC828DRAFT_196209 [Blastocladiella britannica]